MHRLYSLTTPTNYAPIMCMRTARSADRRGKSESLQATPNLETLKMSILDLGKVIFGDVDQQIGWFQSKGRLTRSKTCPACNQPMNMQTRSDVTDQYRYHVQVSSTDVMNTYFVQAANYS